MVREEQQHRIYRIDRHGNRVFLADVTGEDALQRVLTLAREQNLKTHIFTSKALSRIGTHTIPTEGK